MCPIPALCSGPDSGVDGGAPPDTSRGHTGRTMGERPPSIGTQNVSRVIPTGGGTSYINGGEISSTGGDPDMS